MRGDWAGSGPGFAPLLLYECVWMRLEADSAASFPSPQGMDKT